jgi:hypothetical protein
VVLWRGAHVTPRDANLEARLKANGEPFLPWRDGILARVRLDHVPGLRQQGLQLRVVYVDGGEMLDEASEFTPVQLDHALSNRIEALARDPQRVFRQHLQTLRLETTLLLVNGRARAVSEKPALVEPLASLGKAAMVDFSMQDTLATVPSLTALLAAERALARDIGFLATWSQQERRDDLAGRLRGWLSFKQSQIAALETAARKP